MKNNKSIDVLWTSLKKIVKTTAYLNFFIFNTNYLLLFLLFNLN